jgi:hypothetical protein
VTDTLGTPSMPSRRRMPKSRRVVLWLIVVAAVAASIGVGVWALTRGSSQHALDGTKTHRFHLVYPSDWKQVPPPRAAAVAAAGKAVAALEQKTGKGLLVLRVGGKSPPLGRSFVQGFANRLRRQVPDAKLTKSVILRLPNKRHALFLSYVRKTNGTLTTITVIPAGKQTYIINTLCAASAVQIGREIGRMIRSFTWQ